MKSPKKVFGLVTLFAALAVYVSVLIKLQIINKHELLQLFKGRQ